MSRKPKPGKDRRQGRMLYFAYGSNLHIRQMKQRCRDAREVGAAVLPGYRLVFRGVADIVKAKGAKVPGAVWSISPRDLDALDRYEGYPDLYIRHVVTVTLADGSKAVAWVYRMVGEDRRSLPSRGYLAVCLEGYSLWGLPHWHLKKALADAAKDLQRRGVKRVVEQGKRTVPYQAPVDDDWRWPEKKARSPRPPGGRIAPRNAGMTPATRRFLALD